VTLDAPHTEVVRRVAAYYSEKVEHYGATARGADWSSPESQELRFMQLARLFDDGTAFSVNDYGCGYGALAAFLRRRGFAGSYRGYDIATAMLAEGRRFLEGLEDCVLLDDPARLDVADYTVASGIFNVKLDIPVAEWMAYVEATLTRMAALSRRGFAFNMLTSYADADRMRPDLYYADPHRYFDRCRAFSRRVALLHDYPLYEFTIIVRLP
jgi:SAM-dependent methyltransferase